MKHRLNLAAAAAVTVAFAGCSPSTNPAREIAAGLGAGPPATERADFVARTRPAELDYLPVGSAPSRPGTAARSAEEVKKLEAELDAVRLRNDARAAEARRAGRSPNPAPQRTP